VRKRRQTEISSIQFNFIKHRLCIAKSFCIVAILFCNRFCALKIDVTESNKLRIGMFDQSV